MITVLKLIFHIIRLVLIAFIPMGVTYKLIRKFDTFMYKKYLKQSIIKSCIYYLMGLIIFILFAYKTGPIDIDNYLYLPIRGLLTGYVWGFFFKINPLSFD